jgi:hypothetical protein
MVKFYSLIQLWCIVANHMHRLRPPSKLQILTHNSLEVGTHHTWCSPHSWPSLQSLTLEQTNQHGLEVKTSSWTCIWPLMWLHETRWISKIAMYVFVAVSNHIIWAIRTFKMQPSKDALRVSFAIHKKIDTTLKNVCLYGLELVEICKHILRVCQN